MSDLESQIKIEFIDKHGISKTVTALPGDTLMQIATFNDISGIDADCGGCCACGTCRMVLEPTLHSFIPDPQNDELSILEFVGEGSENQRLGCQITVDSNFNNTKIKVATD